MLLQLPLPELRQLVGSSSLLRQRLAEALKLLGRLDQKGAIRVSMCVVIQGHQNGETTQIQAKIACFEKLCSSASSPIVVSMITIITSFVYY